MSEGQDRPAAGRPADDEPTDGEEVRALGALPREVEPPPELEERVVEAVARARPGAGLRGAGFRPPDAGHRAPGAAPSRRWRAFRVLATAAVMAVVFGAGWAAGRGTTGPVEVPPPPGGELFVLLLTDGPGFDPGARSPEEVVSLYGAWGRSLRRQGRLVMAEKLADGAGTTVGPEDDASAVSGFFLVRAADADEAVRLARESPHAGFGGGVVVKRIEETPGP